MRPPLVVWLPLLVLLAGTARVQGQSPTTAEQWLEHMTKATRTLNYEGTFTYVDGQNIDVMALIHSYSDGHERQRMYSLSGAPREVVVQNDQVICLLPDQRLAIKISKYTRSPFPISFPQNLASLKQNYRFALGGEDRVVDRDARIVSVLPRDHLRYGYKLWLDEGTGLVLRSALVDQRGDYLEQLIFTRLQLKSHIDPSELSPDFSSIPAVKTVTEPLQDGTSDGKPKWQVTRLPPGFTAVVYQWHAATANHQPNEQIVYSDGLATVSVFVEQLKGSPLLQGPSRMDSMNAYGAIVDKHYQVLAVGEVPPETVQMIATSIRMKQPRSGQ